MTSNAEDKRNREREGKGRKGERVTLHKRREGEEETTTRGEAGVGLVGSPTLKALIEMARRGLTYRVSIYR